MNYRDIAILSQNSHLTSKYIAHFLSGQLEGAIKIEFVYLLLPLLHNRDTRNRLSQLNSSSTLESAFRLNTATFYSGINLRYTYFQHQTNLGIIVAARKYSISIADYLEIDTNKRLNYRAEKDQEIQRFCKAAYNFGRLLKKNESAELFVKLGILIS